MQLAKIESSIVSVKFNGGNFGTIKGEDGKLYIHFKRVCEDLGVSYSKQLAKMKNTHWCVLTDKCTVAQDGKQRTLTMIDLESLPMWLATINIVNVHQDIKEKLRLYQLESKALLVNHFLGSSANLPALTSALTKAKKALSDTQGHYRKAYSSLRVESKRADKLEKEVTSNRQIIKAITNPLSTMHGEYLSVKDYIDIYRVLTPNGQELTAQDRRMAGKQVKALAKAMKVSLHGHLNVYSLGVLNAWRTINDMRSRLDRATFKKAVNGKLFK